MFGGRLQVKIDPVNDRLKLNGNAFNGRHIRVMPRMWRPSLPFRPGAAGMVLLPDPANRGHGQRADALAGKALTVTE